MISTTNFSLFPSDELFTFAKGALTIVEEKRTAIPSLIPFLDKANQQLSLYQNALERTKKNPYTELQAEKDSLRDDSFMVLRTYMEAMSYRAKAGWSAAATKILEVIRRHGWNAASMGYKAETAAINSITSELRGKYATEIVFLNAEELLAELEADQRAFEETSHLNVKNAPTSEPTIWEVRPTLSNSLKSLFTLISLLNTSAPSRDLSTLESVLNELIVRSLSTVKANETRSENQPKKTSVQPNDSKTQEVAE
ncbi:MAG: hypothetical protein HXX16_10205 [Bacteroidales bacterium]|nr:hypothetical protein [Bacteroidales bacterium]